MRPGIAVLLATGLWIVLAASAGAQLPGSPGPAISAGSSGPAGFLGLTVESRAGDLGGSFGADLLCQRAFPQSHMCQYDEIAPGQLSALLPYDAWIGPPRSIGWASNLKTASGSCREWHTGTVGLGTVLDKSGGLRLLPCSIPRRLACCG